MCLVNMHVLGDDDAALDLGLMRSWKNADAETRARYGEGWLEAQVCHIAHDEVLLPLQPLTP